jgi:hypothetical protein
MQTKWSIQYKTPFFLNVAEIAQISGVSRNSVAARRGQARGRVFQKMGETVKKFLLISN